MLCTTQNGLLTMDQARSLLPLSADDPQVFMVPLVGVWIKGARGVDDAAVLAASLRFAYSGALPDKALQGAEAAFLVLLFPAGEAREGAGQGVDGNIGHVHPRKCSAHWTPCVWLIMCRGPGN